MRLPGFTVLLTVLALTSLLSRPASGADCSAPGKAEYLRGSELLDKGDTADALAALQSAVDTCPMAEVWQTLGDAYRVSFTSDDAMREQSAAALEAYGNAFAAARSDRDDEAGAQAARSIVEVGLLTGDPLKAQNWLMVASNLEPDHPDLADLETRLDTARNQLSTEEIDTGLSATRGIGTVNSLLGGSVTSRAFWDAEENIENTESDTDRTSEGGGGLIDPSISAIDIPIRFSSNSTQLTPETAANVRNLARVLSAQPETTHFILTGHADVRGEADYNLRLSLARAEAIRDLLVDEAPTLDGRVEALGDGETRPVDAGSSERAHANNRRLEITVVRTVSAAGP